MILIFPLALTRLTSFDPTSLNYVSLKLSFSFSVAQWKTIALILNVESLILF